MIYPKLIIFFIILIFSSCSNSSNKENELLKRELELAKKELELAQKEEKIDEVNEQSTNEVYRKPINATTYQKTNTPIENTQSKEKNDPMKYLKLDFQFNTETYRKGLGTLKIRTEERRKYVAQGSIYNNAIYTTFSNATIEVRYTTSNGSIIGTQRLKINKYISPKKSVSFKSDLNIPNGTNKVSGILVSVTSVN